MMRFEVMENNEWLRLVEYDDELDLRQIEISFTKKVKDHFFRKKYSKNKSWDGSIEFFKKKRFLPIGLWTELLNVSKQHGLGVTIDGLRETIDDGLTIEEFTEWVNEFFKDGIGGDPNKKPRDYQVKAAFLICKFKRTSQELATSAGKTLITFMAIAFLLHTKRIKRFIMIVPTLNLVVQGIEDFQEYGAYRVGMKFQQVGDGAKDIRSEANVVIGTYQTLVKFEQETLGTFDCAFVDEAHQTPAKSIKEIIGKVVNGGGGRYRFGLSGTLTAAGKDSADFFTSQTCLGPMVNEVSADFLFQNKYATPVDIRIVKMNYLNDETRQQLARLKQTRTDLEGSDIFNLEKKLVIRSRERLNFVVDFILRTTKNSIVLFQSVEEGYGRAIYDLIREKSPDKEAYYVDGNTDNSLRDEYKKRMEEGENRIIIASFGTFSTGISIKNLHNIFLVESYKSENIIKQSLGRMMRLHADKETAVVVDFVDDFSYNGKPNYLLNHMFERIKIYEKEKFPYKEFNVDLRK